RPSGAASSAAARPRRPGFPAASRLRGMASGTDPRVAGVDDADRVTEIFLDAFRLDPVWGYELPDREQEVTRHAAFWRYYVDNGLPNEFVWISGDSAAAALWVPPGLP